MAAPQIFVPDYDLFCLNIDVAGNAQIDGNAQVDGALNVTGGINIVGPLDATSIGTNILRDNSAITDTQIIMQSNGGLNDYFDIQRVDGLHVDEISTSSTGNIELNSNTRPFNDGILLLGDVTHRFGQIWSTSSYATSGLNADNINSYTTGNMQLNPGLLGKLIINGDTEANADDARDLGTSAVAFRNMFLNQLRINQKASYAQLVNINTAVGISGAESAFQITTQAASTASTASDVFTVTNASVLVSSYIQCQVVSYSGVPFTNGVPQIFIENVLAGSFDVRISNFGGSALSGTFVLRFLVY